MSSSWASNKLAEPNIIAPYSDIPSTKRKNFKLFVAIIVFYINFT